MNRAGLWVGTVLAIGLAVAGYVYTQGPFDEAADAEASEEGTNGDGFQAPPALSTPVTATEVGRGELVMRITATGVAEAERVLNVTSEVAGKLAELPVAEGDAVEAGQLLVQLDDSEYELQVQEAQEQLLNRVMLFAADQLEDPATTATGSGGASTEMSALEFLRAVVSERGYRTIMSQPEVERRLEELSREELFKAQAGLTAQTVAVQRAELDLERTRITAPFGGRVTGIEAQGGPNARRWPVVGQQINAGAELMMIVDDDPIELRVEVIESEASQVREGRKAEVRFVAYPGEVFTGTIEMISPLVDPDRKSLTVTVSLPNPDGRLKPGLSATVLLDTEIFEDRLLVPESSVLNRNERDLVFVVKGGRAQWAYITKGLENAEWVEVLEGVEEGDVVVTGGHFTLAHDTPVEVVEELEEPAGPVESGR